ncbi:MAG: sulfite exporter TauE/SafE family protein, partial [Magnetospirillum sp.]|nr:sulfite exporter TauE/SafE family protein [Roseomonas sp.]MBX9633370.1 sulfite exporter TauE/SafE family protein [Magnetospirillum sp.]
MTSLLLIGAGAAAGAFVSGVSGFAYGLVALSLWSWQVEPALLAPMVVFGSLVAQLFGLHALGHPLEWRPAVPLVVGGTAGVPIGVALLDHINLPVFQLVVGLLLTAYALTAFLAAGQARTRDGGRMLHGTIGFAGGILGGLAGLHGSLPALWATLCGWSKERQRSVFLSFNTAMAVLILIWLAAVGKMGPETVPMFAVILPATVVPAWLGTRVYRGLGGAGFRR